MARRSRSERGAPEPTATAPPNPRRQERAGRFDVRFALMVVAVLVLATSVRLWGVRWGLPGADRMCTYHPDEGVNLFSGVLVNGVARPHLDIGFYNYGSLYFLLWQAAVAVNSAYGLVREPLPSGAMSWLPAPERGLPETDTIGAMILVGRLLTVAGGALTCLALIALGIALGRRRVGIIAAIIYAVAPLATVHGRFATVDVTATLLVALVMTAAVALLKRGTLGLTIVAGLLSGLASATRYNVALVALSPLAAIWLSPRSDPGAKGAVRSGLTGALLAAVASGFVIGCPGVLMNWSKFWADISYEAQKSAQGMGLLFEGTGNGWAYHYLSSLRHGLGWPTLCVVSAGAVFALVRRRPADLVLLAFAAPYYLLMGSAQVRFMRYMLPLMPALCVWAATLASFSDIRWRRLGIALLAAAILWSAMMSVGFSKAMASVDPRDEALIFLRDRLGPGARIAFGTTPWYWSPPLSPLFTAPAPGAARRRAIIDAEGAHELRLPRENREWDPEVFRDPEPECVVVSDLESQDAVRLRRAAALDFLRSAARGRRIETFGARPRVLGIRAVPEGYLPNDLLYVCPRITVYLKQ